MNWVDSWPHWLFALLTAALLGATLLVMGWLKRVDGEFPSTVRAEWRHAAILEWQMRPSDAAAIVAEWKAKTKAMDVAAKGLAIDTFVFIPIYSTFLALLGFWAARASAPASGVREAMLALAWCGWVAGALDLIENAGIFVEERCGWFFAAPPTATMALMKWGLALIVFWAAVGRLLVAAILRR